MDEQFDPIAYLRKGGKVESPDGRHFRLDGGSLNVRWATDNKRARVENNDA